MKKEKGRPKGNTYGGHLSIHIDDTVYRVLHDIAKKEQTSIASLIRRCLNQYLEKEDIK